MRYKLKKEDKYLCGIYLNMIVYWSEIESMAFVTSNHDEIRYYKNLFGGEIIKV